MPAGEVVKAKLDPLLDASARGVIKGGSFVARAFTELHRIDRDPSKPYESGVIAERLTTAAANALGTCVNGLARVYESCQGIKKPIEEFAESLLQASGAQAYVEPEETHVPRLPEE